MPLKHIQYSELNAIYTCNILRGKSTLNFYLMKQSNTFIYLI